MIQFELTQARRLNSRSCSTWSRMASHSSIERHAARILQIRLSHITALAALPCCTGTRSTASSSLRPGLRTSALSRVTGRSANTRFSLWVCTRSSGRLAQAALARCTINAQGAIDIAIGLFGRALDSDPRDAVAHAGKGDAYGVRGSRDRNLSTVHHVLFQHLGRTSPVPRWHHPELALENDQVVTRHT
jgi:hypothetical protein